MGLQNKYLKLEAFLLEEEAKQTQVDGLQDLTPVFLGQQGAAARGPHSSERIRVNWLLTKLCM